MRYDNKHSSRTVVLFVYIVAAYMLCIGCAVAQIRDLPASGYVLGKKLNDIKKTANTWGHQLHYAKKLIGLYDTYRLVSRGEIIGALTFNNNVLILASEKILDGERSILRAWTVYETALRKIREYGGRITHMDTNVAFNEDIVAAMDCYAHNSGARLEIDYSGEREIYSVIIYYGDVSSIANRNK